MLECDVIKAASSSRTFRHHGVTNNNNNDDDDNNNNNSVLYLHVLTHQLQDPITESAQVNKHSKQKREQCLHEMKAIKLSRTQ
jgi:hypothetical protein